MKKHIAGWSVALLTAAILAWSQAHYHSEPSIPSVVRSTELLKDNPVPWSATKNTTRLNTSDPISAAVLTSKTLWPATDAHQRPETVVLVDSSSWPIAAAAAELLQGGKNSLLFVEEDGIPKETLEELRRLKPRGAKRNKEIEIITVGPISDRVRAELGGLDYRTDHIEAMYPAAAASAVDAYIAKAYGERSSAVIIGSMDRPDYTLPAVNWIAHQPESLLYVTEEGIPGETAAALKLSKGSARIYLLGPEKAISGKVEQQLRKFGTVTRIEGDNPYENALNFAQYKDGANGFGWGNQPGHPFSFVHSETPILAVAAAPLSHMGRHAPLIFTKEDGIPRSFLQYVESIRIRPGGGSSETFNHAWIIGDEHDISNQVQGQIDSMLEELPSGME